MKLELTTSHPIPLPDAPWTPLFTRLSETIWYASRTPETSAMVRVNGRTVTLTVTQAGVAHWTGLAERKQEGTYRKSSGTLECPELTVRRISAGEHAAMRRVFIKERLRDEVAKRPPLFIPELSIDKRKARWLGVRSSWFAAERALAAGKVDNLSTSIRSLRVLSCNGDVNTPPCPSRGYSHESQRHFCNECSCGYREHAVIENRPGEDGPSMLDFPELECPRQRPGFANGINLRDYFDAVYVVSLKRRPDRLETFWNNFRKTDWPFKTPEVFEAVDGRAVQRPMEWRHGAGAYGCYMSHLTILRNCIQENRRNVLILEDDATFCASFNSRVAAFLHHVPDQWDNLMIGGQFFNDSRIQTINEHVKRVTQCERTHCFALNHRGMRLLADHWTDNYKGHCDHMLGDWQMGSKVFAYAPSQFLAGQAANQSDISGRRHEHRFWEASPEDFPIFYLDAPRDVVDNLSTENWTRGTTDRDGYSYEVRNTFREVREKSIRRKRLQRALRWIQDSAYMLEDGVACVYCPTVSYGEISKYTNKLIYLRVSSVDEAKTAYETVIRKLKEKEAIPA